MRGDRNDDIRSCLTTKWLLSTYRFVDNDAQTPDICTRINRQSARLLGRHVGYCSDHKPGRGFVGKLSRLSFAACGLWSYFREFCEPEIQNLHVAVAPEHDVVEFDVAMDDSSIVSCRQRRSNLDRY